MRVGFGYDVHPLVEGRQLVIGGVRIEHSHGLAGHSDADVLCHAIADALLGAGNLGDIGTHFPNTDPAYADISSLVLLQKIDQILRESRFRIVNVDSTVVLETPMIVRYADSMREKISNALGIESNQVSIKATTSENLGFVGRKEGATAFAVALIQQSQQ